MAGTTRPKLLIASDLSDNALAALHVGEELATALNAEVTLLSCFDPEPFAPPVYLPGVRTILSSIEQEMGEVVSKTLGELREKHLQGLAAVRTDAIRGSNAAMAICDYAKEHGVDWIVVGTHGRTGLKHMLIGSVAEKIVRHAECSVVVARSRPAQ
ncbi:MAG: universal stress protein A [Polyangiales bacterium]|jgi:universal stress protein A